MSHIRDHHFANANVLSVLKDARALLSERGAWTQDTFARDRDGDYAPYASSRASCWCATGAVRRASADRGFGTSGATGASRFLNAALPPESTASDIVYYNDMPSRRKKDIIGLFDRAIGLAEKEIEG